MPQSVPPIAIPGLGIVIAGPLAAVIAGAGAGSAAGGLVGAPVAWGIPEERVQRSEVGFKNGGMLLGVRSRSDDDATFFAKDWKKNRAADVCG